MGRHCNICEGRVDLAFESVVLGKYNAEYYLCTNCDYLSIRDPHWLNEAYQKAISVTDTGLVSRNYDLANKLAALLPHLDSSGKPYLDFAGGLGLMVRLMRDRGFDFFWMDKFSRNELAVGFEYADGMGDCAAVTAFEVLEHLENPYEEIKEVLALSNANSFIFSTELYTPPLPAHDWWYFAKETGQHIGFFTHKTLEILARRLGLRLYSAGSFHMITSQNFCQIKFRILTSRAAGGISRAITKNRPGFTLRDHHHLLNQLSNREKN